MVNAELAIMGGVITLLVGLVTHLLTKERMNDKFTEQINKVREEYLQKADHDKTCSHYQKEANRASDEAFDQIKGLRTEIQTVNKTLSNIEGGLKAKGII